TEAALLYDAVHMLALGLLAASQSKDIKPQSLNCHSRELWSDGATVMNYIAAVRDGRSLSVSRRQLLGARFQPLSGPISLDSGGFRSGYQLVLKERLPYPGSHRFGYWTEKSGLVVTRNYTQTKEEIRETLRGKTLYVTTIIEEPFVLYLKPLQPGEEPLPDPELWDGFCVDLLKNMSGRLGFNISMRRVRDNQYGKIVGSSAEGKEIWNGMIGELMNRVRIVVTVAMVTEIIAYHYKPVGKPQTADLAIASLTITYDRERVVDFTTPFMSLGLSIIYKKPQKEKPSLFSFLYPLSPTVWAYMLAAYLIVSFVLFTVARFSPFEWYSPSSCNADSDVVENQFSLANSFWFTIGSLMQQGSEMAPRANSTRIVSGSWWFFTLIMISSYTANLAAFLTVKRMKSPIENVEDLSKQKEINYGILESGSTFRFFQKATIPTYKSMYEYMSANAAKSFVKSTQQGIERVLNENYAFILESTMNEYYAERNCQLMQVGGLLDSKGYGIGMPA
uniref:Glutamate receptor n=1 Tax=Macrostomum lignano TaxID=282301 RepID=A0A1I8JEP0_9PLAT